MLPSQFWWPCLLTIPNKEKKKKKNNPIPNKDLFLHLKHPPLHTLGYPWLQQHNPHMDWRNGCISRWERSVTWTVSNSIHQSSKTFFAFRSIQPLLSTCRLSRPSRGVQEAWGIVINSAKTYDYATDLLPGAPLSTSCLYSLSQPKREAMEKFITDSLAAGIIQPSSSPLGPFFFFVEKKDKTLRPCIDYCGLNEITVKNRYPLPLLSSAFELLNSYNIQQMWACYNWFCRVIVRGGFKISIFQFKSILVWILEYQFINFVMV